MIKKLKINFILPFVAKSGGIAVVLEYARRLRSHGWDAPASRMEELLLSAPGRP